MNRNLQLLDPTLEEALGQPAGQTGAQGPLQLLQAGLYLSNFSSRACITEIRAIGCKQNLKK